jgi:hypothetical protein
MMRPGFDMRASNSSHRLLEDLQVELRHHCNLQSQHCGARGRDRQKPLRDPRNQIGAIHVCIPD